jgi:hypothetical protein
MIVRSAIDTRYNQSINPPPDAVMSIKELLIQEIDSTPDELLADLLSLVRSLNRASRGIAFFVSDERSPKMKDISPFISTPENLHFFLYIQSALP